MEYKDLLPILDDLHKELVFVSPNVSAIILVADHISGSSKYYSSGFVEVRAALVKMLLDKDKELAMAIYLNILEVKKEV